MSYTPVDCTQFDVTALVEGVQFSISSQDDPRIADWELFYHFTVIDMSEDGRFIEIEGVSEVYNCPDLDTNSEFRIQIDVNNKTISATCEVCGKNVAFINDIRQALNLVDYNIISGEMCTDHDIDRIDWDRVFICFHDEDDE